MAVPNVPRSEAHGDRPRPVRGAAGRAHPRARAPPGRPQPGQRRAALPAGHRRRRAGRRHAACAGVGGRLLGAAQLLVYASAAHAEHSRPEQHPCPRGVPRRGDPGQHRGRRGGPPDPPGGAGSRRVRDPGGPGRQRLRRGRRPRPDAGPPAGDVRTHLGHAARTPRRVWVPVAGDLDEGLLDRPLDGADHVVPANDHLRLALRGGPLRAEDQRVVGAFAAQAAVCSSAPGSSRAAAAAAPLAEATARARPCWPPSATTCARRSPRPRRRCPASAAMDVDLDHERPRRAAGDRGRVPRPARRPGRQPARHEPAAGRRDVGRSCSRSPSRRWSPGRSTTSARRGRRSSSTCPTTCPACSADPGLLERVLANLVANALRYSPAGDAARA